MLMILSPAKTLDFDSPRPVDEYTRPRFVADSRRLISSLRELTPADLAQLMKLSDSLAETNCERYASFKSRFDAKGARHAISAFKGDVYVGLGSQDFSTEDYAFAQDHLRILSGLYGVLRPLDLIQPHRLEMGTRLRTERGGDLYQFWGDRITDALKAELETQPSRTIVNLASLEYFKSVRAAELDAHVITPVFQDWKNGAYKTISFFAKKARGLLSRFAIENRLTDPQHLKEFSGAGYGYSPRLSNRDSWVFTRR